MKFNNFQKICLILSTIIILIMVTISMMEWFKPDTMIKSATNSIDKSRHLIKDIEGYGNVKFGMTTEEVEDVLDKKGIDYKYFGLGELFGSEDDGFPLHRGDSGHKDRIYAIEYLDSATKITPPDNYPIIEYFYNSNTREIYDIFVHLGDVDYKNVWRNLIKKHRQIPGTIEIKGYERVDKWDGEKSEIYLLEEEKGLGKNAYNVVHILYRNKILANEYKNYRINRRELENVQKEKKEKDYIEGIIENSDSSK